MAVMPFLITSTFPLSSFISPAPIEACTGFFLGFFYFLFFLCTHQRGGWVNR